MHVSQCCSPELNGGGGWGIFNAIFGWNNTATYGSVISYNMYWVAVMTGFLLLKFHEKHGRLLFAKNKAVKVNLRQSLFEGEHAGSDQGVTKDGAHSTAVRTNSST